MSSKAVLLSLIIALVLGGAVYLTTLGKGKQGAKSAAAGNIPVGTPILSLDPSTVSRFRIRMPDGSESIVTRDVSAGFSAWKYATGARPDTKWDLAPERVSSFLRLLTTAQSTGEVTAVPGEQIGRVVIEFGILEGPGPERVRELQLSDRSLAGEIQVLADSEAHAPGAKVEQLRAMTADSLLRLVQPPGGPRSWRQGQILAVSAADPWDPLESTCRHASLSIL